MIELPKTYRVHSRFRTFAAGEKVHRFAWLPRKLSSGSWIWLQRYYVRLPYVIDPEALSRSRRRFF